MSSDDAIDVLRAIIDQISDLRPWINATIEDEVKESERSDVSRYLMKLNATQSDIEPAAKSAHQCSRKLF
jgi:hypothetical protein